ncbi:MAG: hypothetical protein HY517_02610 [Candidatus Aenigmarchaeota archaeon]|nr:hypothetical protein [Candidatus Aenigmarchaeota archaeon]
MRTVRGRVINSIGSVGTILDLTRRPDMYLGMCVVQQSLSETGAYVDRRFNILADGEMLSVEFKGADRYADKLRRYFERVDRYNGSHEAMMAAESVPDPIVEIVLGNPKKISGPLKVTRGKNSRHNLQVH